MSWLPKIVFMVSSAVTGRKVHLEHFHKKRRLYCIGNLRSFLMSFADLDVLWHYLLNSGKCIHIVFRTVCTKNLFPYQYSARLDFWSQEIMPLKQRHIKICIQLLKQQNKAGYLQLQYGMNYICNTEGSMLCFTLYPDSEEISKLLLTCDFWR